MDPSDNDESAIDAYHFLVDWYKWTHKSYEKQYRMFLTIEIVLLGVTLKTLESLEEFSFVQYMLVFVLIMFGAGLC